MKKMNKKAFLPILIGLVVIGAVLVVGGMAASSVGLFGLGRAGLCEETPFNSKCTCLEDEEQINIGGIPTKYICEKTNKFINPDLPGWEEELKTKGMLKLAELYPDCDMKYCDRENTEWKIVKGVRNREHRIVYMECEGTNRYRFSEIGLDVVTGAVMKSSCGNYNEVVQETTAENPIKLNFKYGKYSIFGDHPVDGYVMWMTEIDSYCNDKDNGIGITTVFSPQGNIQNWKLMSGGYHAETQTDGRRIPMSSNEGSDINIFVGNCEILEQNQNYATIKCDTNCPHPPFSGYDVQIVGIYDENFWQTYPKCKGDNGWYYGEGEEIVCNNIRTMYQCQNGEWVVTSTSARSTRSVCPA